MSRYYLPKRDFPDPEQFINGIIRNRVCIVLKFLTL